MTPAAAAFTIVLTLVVFFVALVAFIGLNFEAMYREIDLSRRMVMQEVRDALLALAAQIDAATNAVAARIDVLVLKLEQASQGGGLTAAEAGEVAVALQNEKQRLEALGRDPEAPVPVEIPTAEPGLGDPAPADPVQP